MYPSVAQTTWGAVPSLGRNMKSLTYIYGLVDPRDDQVFYVGKTSCSLSARLKGHSYESKKRRSPKERWFADAAEAGFKPLIVELARLENPTFEEWKAAEQAWIDFYGLTSPLTNTGVGGQGSSIGLGKIDWTPELDSLLGQLPDVELAEQIGCKHQTVWYRRVNHGIPPFDSSLRSVEGMRKANLGRRPSDLSIAKLVERTQKDYVCISPDGDRYEVKNLKAFCEAHSLTDANMVKVANGERNHHKQWKCERR